MSTLKLSGLTSGSSIIKAPDSGSTGVTFTMPAAAGTLLTTTGSAANLTAIPAAQITGALPAISGASLTNLPSKGKNLIINGAMQVAQRSTSAVAQANDSNEGYATLDRYSLEFGNNAGGTITTSKDSESPTGFGSSYKLDVTTADTSVDTNHLVFFAQCIEAQTLRSCGWDYTSASSYLTLSFWVKNSKTGIYCVAFNTYDTSRQYTAEYTISQANTWEKKTITIPGNSVLTFNDDNGAGLRVHFMLANASGRYGSAGSWTSGNAWGTSNQVNFLDSTSNVGYWTGIQLELGSTATDFEQRSYGEELALCQRYYQSYGTYINLTLMHGRYGDTAGLHTNEFVYTNSMRTAPTLSYDDNQGNSSAAAIVAQDGTTTANVNLRPFSGRLKASSFNMNTYNETTGLAAQGDIGIANLYNLTLTAEL